MSRLAAVYLFAVATGASAEGYGFRTPTGNIYCNGSIEASEIRCSIVERSGSPAMPDTGTCSAFWGHHVRLDRTGPARVVCGEAPRKSSYTDVAPYGVSAGFAEINCRSEKTGLQCTNREGHGFLLSRKEQRVW
ncbi:DUF6636 domain-containing protein [Paracoccus jeotgali]|uniref:DUF6636 domain-containing protein n=1 Tax=Paracoccus jeotgali TaxID=2065379 RepID=UPI0028AA96EF|nr:DUF6636 domain-containing protein [Paracoccus jeotgali]